MRTATAAGGRPRTSRTWCGESATCHGGIGGAAPGIIRKAPRSTRARRGVACSGQRWGPISDYEPACVPSCPWSVDSGVQCRQEAQRGVNQGAWSSQTYKNRRDILMSSRLAIRVRNTESNSSRREYPHLFEPNEKGASVVKAMCCGPERIPGQKAITDSDVAQGMLSGSHLAFVEPERFEQMETSTCESTQK